MDLQYVQGKPLFTTINSGYKKYPCLNENINTEVVIVGGGVTGGILGYYFTKHNIPAVILEKGKIGYGSTSITTSLLQYELDENLNELAQGTTIENSIKAYKLGIDALDEIDRFISEHGNNCDYKKKSTLLYTDKDLEKKEIEEEYKLRKEYNFDVKFIDEANNPFSFDLKAGVYSNNGGAELDPYKYTHQLLDVSCRKGLKVYENTEAVKVSYNINGVQIDTIHNYKVRGKIVIVATGYNTKLFTNRNFGTETTTFNIATKPVGDFSGWPDRVLIRDNSDPYNYLRTTADNRIIIGGEDVDFVPEIFNEKIANDKYAILEGRLKSMFKNIKNIEIEYKYCGAFASTKDNLGFLGVDPKNKKLWYCLGYGANGILFSILGGMMLSKLYLGEMDENLKLFKVDRFDN
ncbi:glycine/D-amino acid oxidase-like deaminating enzyme [Clostridium tetanomorphum]|uniref:FAD-binding oxidoreductase n=1 Tax=Clostridium tetanomorphum TaxID=1553 RepID=A0A923J0G2_CLOTT|nr:FAD-binding oxidoreductase [Clostridium tetanomorphum]KAJ51118.1 putative oxidoreductase [Clostridium tetanomorphum DSM 665]MBC2398037.1 FAD-binding oxidoreductase [Clostridium tetanomorphum]MBP1864454.1 glycine/D-amino acid oxidase-like deaminating enzyme [Clostridium tetanomorphum]NRS83015.1 glycine/D-amino acid oxidase-like deaminating enzyme [Clostridium tetanomorphum]NRZ98889.1 glycine/D-amino acid oxidase-like deaminating enzyme [Clostridium tetanomorphum]